MPRRTELTVLLGGTTELSNNKTLSPKLLNINYCNYEGNKYSVLNTISSKEHYGDTLGLLCSTFISQQKKKRNWTQPTQTTCFSFFHSTKHLNKFKKKSLDQKPTFALVPWQLIWKETSTVVPARVSQMRKPAQHHTSTGSHLKHAPATRRP